MNEHEKINYVEFPIKNIFSFPGKHRFHFKEPSGNEFAVWSK